MKKVLDFVQRFDLLPRYELLLAAASGGLDSMCLLDFLYENGYRVCAAHYNHQLRGQEADMDEDLVRAWCAARRIPLCVGTGDVAAYAGENGLTIEEAARKLRYDFLNSVAGQTGAARIVTAHHANDNAETVLFHLARGTGMAGLAGIAPKNGRLVRPFLCLTREELAAYAKEHHVPYRTDATNADTALTRNFIRAEVLPRLCRVNAQAVEHIGETALRLRQEDEYLDSLAAAYLTELKTEAGAVTLPCAAVAQVPRGPAAEGAAPCARRARRGEEGLHRRALRRACRALRGKRDSAARPARRRDRAAHGRRVDALRTPEGNAGARFAPRRGDRPVGRLCHHLPKVRKNG